MEQGKWWSQELDHGAPELKPESEDPGESKRVIVFESYW